MSDLSSIIDLSNKGQRMTHYIKTLLKASFLSLALTVLTVFLGITTATNSDPYISALAQMGTFVIGMFTIVAIISTTVYMFVGDERI
jgi:Na+-transporting NADH:ubiquinone oxidoreductase subunit NqrE